MRKEGEPESLMRSLLDRLALAHALAPESDGWVSDRALVLIRSLRETTTSQAILAENVKGKYGIIRPAWRTEAEESHSFFGLEFAIRPSALDPTGQSRAWWQELLPNKIAAAYRDRHCMHVLLAEGFHASRFLAYEEGTHLFALADDRIEPLQVVVLPVASGQQPGNVLLDTFRRHDQALASEGHDLASPSGHGAGILLPSPVLGRGAGGEGTLPLSPHQPLVAAGKAESADPLRWRPTVSLWYSNRFFTDLQSGFTEMSSTMGTWCPEKAWNARELMATLPLPPEFEDLR